jgi:hypothetical protein
MVRAKAIYYQIATAAQYFNVKRPEIKVKTKDSAAFINR